MTTTSLPTSIGWPRFARFMKSTPYWTPLRSAPGTSSLTAFIAPAAGALPRRRADVGAHRCDRVRLPGQDVALLEAALSREVQVAPAVRPDRTGFLTLDVALEPRRVDRLNEEFLVGVDRHEGGRASPVETVSGRTGSERERAGTPLANLPSASERAQKATRGNLVDVDARGSG